MSDQNKNSYQIRQAPLSGTTKKLDCLTALFLECLTLPMVLCNVAERSLGIAVLELPSYAELKSESVLPQKMVPVSLRVS
jgi:hypothetical protein